MPQKEIRSAVTAQFYQSLAESGVEITAIPQAQLQAMVNALADGFNQPGWPRWTMMTLPAVEPWSPGDRLAWRSPPPCPRR